MFISMVIIMLFMISSVSAVDLNNASDNSNLLQYDNNKVVFSSQNLDVSSNDSISDTKFVNSRNDNLNDYPFDTLINNNLGSGDILGLQYISENIIQDNGTNETILVGNDTEMYFKNGTSYKVLLTDNNGSPLSNQSIQFSINGNTYNRTTNENGTASILINLHAGNYNITSYFAGTDVYSSSSITNFINVLSTISADDIEKYYRNDTQFYAKFLNGNGTPLVNTSVSFNINGVFYNRDTDENGTARLNINLQAGDYVITSINTNGEMYSNNIAVLTTILANDTVKYYRNDTQFYALFLTNTGNPLINQTVSFNINGIFYNRTTNENGIARMNINLNPDNYTITCINTNGEMRSRNIEVLPTISASDVNMYYRDGTKFTASVVDGTGNELANSTVTFNINGVFYNRTTNESGVASLNINLNNGNYIITSTNVNGLSVSNKITIQIANSTIIGNYSHLITGIDKNYTVKLMGLNNNSISSAMVYFSYDNDNVTAVTNEYGEATITLSNLSEGNHTIFYEFKGSANYNPSNSSSLILVSNSTVKLLASNLTMSYKDGSKFNVTLTDLKNNPLANETISFNINGIIYNRTTNDNGVAGLTINLIPDTYVISYSYSDINSEDYNEGSNNIIVSKLVAKLTANDLAFEYGDHSSFEVVLTDNNNLPINNTEVTINVNNVSYGVNTNESGVAKLNINLGVGYYPVFTSLDNIYYSANNITNHILVNGTVFEAKDLTMIVGSSANYSVTLKDAYGNGVSGAQINFTYANVVQLVNTTSNGVATIVLSNLTKGIYPIIYTFENNSGQSYVHVVGSILFSQLISTANYVNSYIENNSKLPSQVSIDGTSYNSAQYLYLLSQAIVDLSNNNASTLAVRDISNPSNPGSASNLGKLYNYVSIAKSILSTMDNGTTPNSVQTSIGTVGYDGIVYAFTRVLVYYGEMASLPSYVSINSLVIYTSTSRLDSANTISDLSAYLASSKNCEVTNSAIVNLANQLTKGLTTSLEKASAIYNYVRDSISYSFYYNTRYGAVRTLSVKSGNCVDHSHLLIALYRAAGLPARYVHGTCVFSSGSTYGHVWTQVLIGNTWVVSDATSSRNSFGKVVNWNNNNYVLKGYYSSISF